MENAAKYLFKEESNVEYEKIYISIQYKDKENAKACGARWDDMGRKWYIYKEDDNSLLKFANDFEKLLVG